MKYVESADEEEDEDVFKPTRANGRKGRALKRRKTSELSDDLEFAKDFDADADIVDEGIAAFHDFV